MSPETDQDWCFLQVNERQSRAPLWRRIVTIAVAAAFTLVTISLGSTRHRHAIQSDSSLSFRASASKLQSERLP
jgi:hypothetical protein